MRTRVVLLGERSVSREPVEHAHLVSRQGLWLVWLSLYPLDSQGWEASPRRQDSGSRWTALRPLCRVPTPPPQRFGELPAHLSLQALASEGANTHSDCCAFPVASVRSISARPLCHAGDLVAQSC